MITRRELLAMAPLAGVARADGYGAMMRNYFMQPQYYVTANLCRPKTIAHPCPGVIESCGHYEEGKAAPDYPSACIGLAKKGIVALIFDPMGQGERLMYRDAPGKRSPGKACLLCAVTSFYHKTRALLTADPEQIMPGIYPAGVDHPELIAAVAPRAFLIGAALKDYVPLEATRPTLRCTPSGCVMDLPGARSVFDIHRDYSRQLVGQTFSLSILATQERGLELPSRLSGSGDTLLVLIAAQRDPTLAEALSQSGRAVMQLDLRGKEFFAWRAIEMGRPLLAMRVSDLLATVQAQKAYKKIYVIGLEGAARC